MMKISPDEIQQRKQVWLALSQLWLDKDHDESSIESIAATLQKSNYTIDELECIHKHEVTPVVWINLLGIGEWIGFDQEWLEKRITANLNKNILIKKLRNLIASMISKMVDKDWKRIVSKMQAKGSR